MKRTQEEILARIDAVAKEDSFGAQRNDLVSFTLELIKNRTKQGKSNEKK